MVTISNVDQVMALVRSQIERLARERKAGARADLDKAGRTQVTSRTRSASRQSRLEALGRQSDLPDEEFGRILVGALLSLEFGENIARDIRFQSLLDRTTMILMTDPHLASLVKDFRPHLRTREGNGQPPDAG